MISHRLKKVYNYELWPFWIFYLPMVPVWLYYSFKTKSLLYFCSVNPNITFGGFSKYSKFNVTKGVDSIYLPKSSLHSKNNLQSSTLSFPFIIKPDIGERGVGVEIIENQLDLNSYLVSTKKEEFIVQEIISLPKEYGVFYVKHPLEKKGKILSITGKKFLTYRGNGKKSLYDFILNNSRAYYRKDYLLKKFKSKLNLILPEGEELILEPIGNHNRGTVFFDQSYLINDNLETIFTEICNSIAGFYYGRIDLKSTNDEDLKNGIFKIIEMNGANSEPTHIYDKKYSLFSAYREVLRHLNWQYKIAQYNLKNGTPKTSVVNFIQKVFLQ